MLSHNDEPNGDINQAVNFLQLLRPGGPWLLSEITPAAEDIYTRMVQTPEEAAEFIRKRNGKCNLYYSVNPTRHKRMNSKAAKTDIAEIEYFFTDLDPKKGEPPAVAKARYLA